MRPFPAVPLLALLLATALTSGCFRSREQVTAKESIGYVQFTGAVEGAQATVKNDQRVFYDSVALAPNTRYSIRPGTYEVVVVRSGETVVRRRLFIGAGHTQEVRVP